VQHVSAAPFLTLLLQDDPIPEDKFIEKWKFAVGDTFESSVSLSLLLVGKTTQLHQSTLTVPLQGNYLSSFPPTDEIPIRFLTYFPASTLPVDPAPRFADLFLTRSHWRGDEIAPFLSDIAVDSKERDKLLLKFARATTDSQGVWYTARAQYNG